MIQTTSAPVSSSSRIAWIDMARGCAMILIVLGHSLIGLLNAGITHNEGAARFWIFFIYLFHVPLIFFVSGFASRDENKNPKTFVLTQLKWLIAPYIIWSFLLILVQKFSGSSVNAPVPFSALLHIWRNPISIFWFLYVLAVVKFLDYGAHRLMSSKNTVCLMLLFAGLALYTLFTAYDAGNELSYKLPASLFFYELGRTLCLHREKLDRVFALLRPRIALRIAVVAILMAILAACGMAYSDADPAALRPIFEPQAYVILTGIIGIVATLIVCCTGENTLLAKGVRIIGTYSMVIYVQHVFWGAGIRAVLSKAHIAAPSIYILIIVGCGLVLPVLWQLVADRLRLTSFFGIRPIKGASSVH